MSKGIQALRANANEFIRTWCENSEGGKGVQHIAKLLCASIKTPITDKDCNAFASQIRQGKVFADKDGNGVQVQLPRMANANKGRKAGQRIEIQSLQTALGSMLSKYGITLDEVTRQE